MVQDILFLSQKYLEGADTAQLPPVYAPSANNLPNPLVSHIVLPTRHTSQRTHPSPSAGPPPIVPVPTRPISTPPDPSPAHTHTPPYITCAHPININAQTLRLYPSAIMCSPAHAARSTFTRPHDCLPRPRRRKSRTTRPSMPDQPDSPAVCAAELDVLIATSTSSAAAIFTASFPAALFPSALCEDTEGSSEPSLLKDF